MTHPLSFAPSPNLSQRERRQVVLTAPSVTVGLLLTVEAMAMAARRARVSKSAEQVLSYPASQYHLDSSSWSNHPASVVSASELVARACHRRFRRLPLPKKRARSKVLKA